DCVSPQHSNIADRPVQFLANKKPPTDKNIKNEPIEEAGTFGLTKETSPKQFDGFEGQLLHKPTLLKTVPEQIGEEIASGTLKNSEEQTQVPCLDAKVGKQAENSGDTKKFNTQIEKEDPEVLQKRYHIGRILGDGNFAVVRLARRRETGQLYAMKIIDKTKLKGKENMLQNEISIMHQCNHPNIVRLIEEFETPNEVWLAMEFVKDGDLFDGITKSVKFSEPVAAVIVADLANALFYLHCRSIVHRDLKPENVLLWRQADGKIRVKLADFGLALEIRRNLYTICGTPTYIAPEILCERGYGLEVDMWALGIITYIMLCGFAPFRTPDRRQSKLFDSIKRGVFVYLSPYWDEVSQAAKDLISQLLVVQPRKRLTALETITHPWVFAEGCTLKLEDPQATMQMDQQRRALRLNLEKRIHEVTSNSHKLNNQFTPVTQPTGPPNNSLPTLFHAVTKPEVVDAKPTPHFPCIYRRIS
ncbi:Doublecortin like kinase 3, partial [Paragonimus heterotremus]